MLRFLLWFLSFPAILYGQTVTILHTNDWQSRYLATGANSDYNPYEKGDGTTGGIARLATMLDQLRAQADGPVLTLDAGDFTMGSLFHTITRETGSELQFLQLLGYDATCLGNHEFDFRPEGLAQMIGSAIKASGKIPPILSSNIVFSNTPQDGQLKEYMDQGVIKRYLVIERGGMRFGLFGLLGVEASEVAPDKFPVTFRDPIEEGKKYVALLKEQKVDWIILLSHSGIQQNKNGEWEGEEVEFAKKIPGLDVIVGGHSHTPLYEPIRIGNTVILQAGSETQFLGELKLSLKPEKKFVSYKLHPLTDQIIGRKDVIEKTEELKAIVNEKVLRSYGYQFDEEIAEISTKFTRDYDDHRLGNLIGDALKTATHADIGFIANGSLRDDIYPGKTGKQRVSDLFGLIPLGVGELDNAAGHPLMKVFFTGRELKSIIEVLLVAYQERNSSYYPRFFDLRFFYNPKRFFLDKVFDIQVKKNGEWQTVDIDDEKTLYSIGTTSYVGSFLWLIEKVSYGLFSIKPKNAQGQIIEGVKSALTSPTEYDQKELKAWVALIKHVTQFKDVDNNGSPDIPISGKYEEAPIIEVDSLSPYYLFKNATFVQWTLSLLLLIGSGVFGFIIYRLSQKKRG